jgi:anti-anti-sigma factor
MIKEAFEALKAHGIQDVIVDFGQCPDIDSFGIGELAKVIAQTNAQKGKAYLARPKESITDLFTISKLNMFANQVDSVETALRK